METANGNVVTTRVLHISDTHLGKRQYGSDVRYEDFATAFEQAIDIAVERDVDAVIHTGDLFDDPQPTLPTVLRCADALDPPTEHEIPLYGIVGTHERRDDDQWLDLFGKTNAVTRLSREPTVIGDTALYGIDAVRPGDWETTDFSLQSPPAGVDCTILCMHELLAPPVDGPTASHRVDDVLERVNIDLDGLALGGLHQPKSTRVDGTEIWYASATERCGADESETGVVQLLEIDDGSISRHQLELETRPFVAPTITFSRDDAISHVRDVLEQHDLTETVTKAELVVEGGGVTANEVSKMAHDAGATVVDVEDNRGYVDCSDEDRGETTLQTAQNAVETAALLGGKRRSGRKPLSAAQNESETGTHNGATRTNDLERGAEVPDDLRDERNELIRERDELDGKLSQLDSVIEDVQAAVDAIEDDLAATIAERDATTKAFLPDDRLPESVSTDTRDAVASYVDTLKEKKDVRSEELSRKNATLTVEKKNAADAREDIAETAKVVDRLEDRVDELESTLDAAREELTELRAEATDLPPSHSETVAEAAGRVEDLQGDLEDLQDDLEEERVELAIAKDERDKADAAIDALETEIDAIEAEIDRVGSHIDEGETSIAAFNAVDELQGKLDERIGELSDLQEEYTELNAERESLDAEIEEIAR